MNEFKEFLKRYRLWILIGISLGILIPLLILYFRNGNQNSLEIKSIQNPYFSGRSVESIELDGISIDSPQQDLVYKVSGINNQDILNILNEMFGYTNDIDLSQDIYLTLNIGTFSYSPENRILILRSKFGLPAWFKISTAEDVEMFFEEYFGINKVEVLEDGEGIYRGRYLLKDLDVGSVYLDGFAFSLESSSEGEISYLSMLLLNEENLEEYQRMPIASLEELTINTQYPKMIFHNEIEDRYYNQNPIFMASSRMAEFFVRSASYLYIFNDSSNGYLLPTYKLSGEGRIENSKDEKFWSESSLFLCSISPEYVFEREIEDKEYQIDPVTADMP